MTCILELNDAAVTLYRGDVVLQRSAGVAVVLGDEVHFGEDALRLSRIHPRQANQQYLTRLSADPLPVPGRRVRNHADLVYLHLKTFKPFVDAEGGDVLLAVPAILSPDQLGVLLGVLQEIGIGVAGFVDAAVAALTTAAVPPRAHHVDVLMQRAVVTSAEAGDGSVSRVGALEVPECGLTRLLDAWINVIADRFVRETRFDPLHAADTEQQLFNQVYDWIERGAPGNDLTIEIVNADHTRRVDLGRGILEDKAAQRFAALADALPPEAHVFLSARSVRLPGLRTTLEARGLAVTALPDHALSRGCMDNLQHIVSGDGELRLVTRLPAPGASAGAISTPAAPAPATTPGVTGVRSMPTHLLKGHLAEPLGGGTLPVHADGDRLVLQPGPGVRLNGAEPEEPTPVAAGDRVSVGEREYLLIRVQD